MCLSLCGYVQMSVGTYRMQNRTLNSLKLELQRVVSHMMWVLGTKLVSFTRTVCDLNC